MKKRGIKASNGQNESCMLVIKNKNIYGHL
jgi:hypothetical protein